MTKTDEDKLYLPSAAVLLTAIFIGIHYFTPNQIF
jgi:hypothetical protein